MESYEQYMIHVTIVTTFNLRVKYEQNKIILKQTKMKHIFAPRRHEPSKHIFSPKIQKWMTS